MGMELRESQHHISVLRPKVSVSQNPREWWKFAFECVRLYKYELGLQSVNQESSSRVVETDWLILVRRVMDRERYVTLHKRRVGAGTMAAGAKAPHA